MTAVLYLLALLTTLNCIIKYGVEGQTGFTQLSSIINCSNIIQFECVSTGPGTTEFMIGNDRLFGISHSLYEGGANTDDIWLNGDVRLTNLSVSAEMECLNLMELPDSCYTMVVEVRLTEQTLCKVFSCRTVLFNGSNTETNHGTATASRVPSAPMNLSMLSQSETSVTFGWNPGSPTCNMNYSVSIQNCGTCNQTSYVSRTNVTCTNLELGQQMQCNVTVQSITECGDFSAPLTDVFKVSTVLSTESTTMNLNVGAIVGIVIAAVIVIGIIIVVLIVICMLVIRSRRSTKRDEERLLTQNTPTPAKQSQTVTVSGLDNKPIPMKSLDQSEQGSPQTKTPTSLDHKPEAADIVDGDSPPSSVKPKKTPTDQPTSSGGEITANGPGGQQSLERTQSKASVGGVRTDDPDSQPPGPQDNQNDSEPPKDQPASSGAQAAANGPGGQQSSEQSQSEASVGGVRTDDPDSQPPGPPDNQNDSEPPTDQPASSGTQAAANGPGGQQLLEQLQSETPTSPEPLNIESEAPALGSHPQPTVKPKASVGGVRTDDPDSQPPGPPDNQNDSEPPTDQPANSGAQAAANGPGEQPLERSQSEETSTDQSTSSEAEIATTGNGERQPLERSQAEKNKSEAFESSDSDSQSLVKTKLKKRKKRKKAVHKMNKQSHPPLSSVDRGEPVTVKLGDELKAFRGQVSQEKNSEETTGTSADTEYHPVLGVNGKLFCEEQSSMVKSTSTSVPSSSSEDGRSLRVHNMIQASDAGLGEKVLQDLEKYKQKLESFESRYDKEIQGLKISQEQQREELKQEIQGLRISQEKQLEEIKKSESKINKLESEIMQLREDLKKKEEYIKELEEKRDADEQYIKELKEKKDADVQGMKKKLEEKQDEVKVTKDQLKNTEDQLKSTKDQLRNMEEQLRNKNDVISRLKERLEQYENPEVTATKDMPDK